MTKDDKRVRYSAAASCAADSVEARIRAAATRYAESDEDEEPGNRYRDRILVEILAQQVASRQHLVILATIAVLGVIASVICAVVIAVQVTKANDHTTSTSSVHCTIYGC